MAKKLPVFLAAVLVGVGVALIYHYFEAVVHESIDRIWYDWLNTDGRRLLVVPAALVLGLIYFGAQHLLDPGSENHESRGLGETPKPTIVNLLKILGIGFLSLVAGASLGPEAVLVPACIIFGSYVGVKVFSNNALAVKVLGAAGFIALFAAFFHSFIIGMLSLLLIKKQAETKLSLEILIIAVLAAGSCTLTVHALSSPTYFDFPDYSWNINLSSLLAIIALVAAGWLTTFGIKYAHDNFEKLQKRITGKNWWYKAAAAALGLSALYLLGGHLVEFTGNKSITLMLHEAPSLGFIGLIWILIVKIGAISWSKSMGYRGGMVFPTIFLASVLVAMSQIFVKDTNFIYGLIAAMAGALAADSKAKILL